MNNFILVRQGDYNRQYLKLLSEQITKHYGIAPICLTDIPTYLCIEQPLKDKDLAGWWAKMELFAPWNKHLRPFWYLDLDSFVMEEISYIRDFDSKYFHMCREWANISPKPSWSQSSMMYVPDDIYVDTIWDKFMEDKANNLKITGGDQVFLSFMKKKHIQDVFPDLIGSYKCHKQQEKRKTEIVTFHGQPKPDRIYSGWARDVWKTI